LSGLAIISANDAIAPGVRVAGGKKVLNRDNIINSNTIYSLKE